MKKLILALIALAFAFAVSSCSNQDYCPENMQCPQRYGDNDNQYDQDGRIYRWNKQERQNRRW